MRPDADDTGSPSVAIEDLSQHKAANEATEEMGGEIEPAGRSAVGTRCTADESRGRCLREEGSDPDERQPGENGPEARDEKERQPGCYEQRPHKAGRVPSICAARPASKVDTMDGAKTK